MVAVLMALGGAVVTAVTYVWLTERMDYATVHRRQLDAWVAISALAFLLAIVYGGAEMRHAARARAALVARVQPGPAQSREVRRLHRPSLGVAAPVASDATVTELSPVPLPDSPIAPQPAGAGPDAPPPDRAEPEHDVPLGRPAQVDTPALAASPLLEPGGGSLVDPTPTIVARRGMPAVRSVPTSVPEVLPMAPVVRPVFVTQAPPTPTQAPPPTPLPPTPEPTVEPPPTPHCGDPNKIDVRIEITEAEAVRRGQPQSVRYAARIKNDTDFPLNLTDLVATAQDSRSGSDQFGSDRKSDIAIGPGHWAEIDGSISLEKYPSPFGRSELCISFVAETCGQRSSQRPVTRRCDGISGF